jgi:hypothetical protein
MGVEPNISVVVVCLSESELDRVLNPRPLALLSSTFCG